MKQLSIILIILATVLISCKKDEPVPPVDSPILTDSLLDPIFEMDNEPDEDTDNEYDGETDNESDSETGNESDSETVNESDEVTKEETDSEKMLRLVNEQRTKGCNCGNIEMPPVNPLQWNSILEQAAYNHSKDMAEHNNMSHTGSDGSSAGKRITELGYKWGYWGENIAQGYLTIEQVMEAWMSSPGHCENIMNANFKEIGAASYKVNENSDIFWTQVFAKPL